MNDECLFIRYCTLDLVPRMINLESRQVMGDASDDYPVMPATTTGRGQLATNNWRKVRAESAQVTLLTGITAQLSSFMTAIPDILHGNCSTDILPPTV